MTMYKVIITDDLNTNSVFITKSDSRYNAARKVLRDEYGILDTTEYIFKNSLGQLCSINVQVDIVK